MIYCGTSMIFNIIIIVTFIIIVIIIHWYAPWIVSYGWLLLCNDDYNDYYGSYCPYLVLLLITCCFYYDDNYDDHADFSRMCSEGFPFIVWGFGGWTLVRLQLLVVASSSRRRGPVNSVSMGEAAKRQSRLEFLLVLWRRCASFVVQNHTGHVLRKLCSTK